MRGRIVGAKVCRRVGVRLRAGALPRDALRSRARARVRTDRAHEVPEVIEDGGVLGRGGGQDQADHRPLAGIGDVQLVGPRPAPTGGSPKEKARPPALASGQRSGDHGGRRVGPVLPASRESGVAWEHVPGTATGPDDPLLGRFIAVESAAGLSGQLRAITQVWRLSASTCPVTASRRPLAAVKRPAAPASPPDLW